MKYLVAMDSYMFFGFDSTIVCALVNNKLVGLKKVEGVKYVNAFNSVSSRDSLDVDVYAIPDDLFLVTISDTYKDEILNVEVDFHKENKELMCEVMQLVTKYTVELCERNPDRLKGFSITTKTKIDHEEYGFKDFRALEAYLRSEEGNNLCCGLVDEDGTFTFLRNELCAA